MLTAIVLQCVAVILGSLVAWVAGDGTTAWFFLLGGAAATIPNGLFALRLAIHRNRPPASYPAVFFIGEFVKIGMTIALLGLIVKGSDHVRALPLLLGLIVALQMPLFALAWSGASAAGTGVLPRRARHGTGD